MIKDSVLNIRFKESKINKSEENVKRSLAKTFSWRIIGTVDTVLISWIITGTLTLAFSIGAIELLTKMALYFGHERVGSIIKWGKQ